MNLLPFDPEHGKSQTIRLLDVTFIGPLMMYGGWHLYQRERLAGAVLGLFGAATIIYNGRNYILIRNKRRGT